MPRHERIEVIGTAPVQLTNADVTNITFAVEGQPMFLQFTADETSPASTDFKIPYAAWSGEKNVLLAELVPGIVAARVWAVPVAFDGFVSVSHA